MKLAKKIKVQDLPVSPDGFKRRALSWADAFPLVAYYDSNQIPYPHGGFKNILAVSSGNPLELKHADAFASLQLKLQENGSLLCGFLSYDLKNQIEKLSSENPDHVGFPLLMFFEPEIYILFEQDFIQIYSKQLSPSTIINQIISYSAPLKEKQTAVKIKQRVTSKAYTEAVEQLKNYIVEGDIYELNYCMEFYAEQAVIHPLSLFLELNQTSPTPFAGFLKFEDKYLLCASPERFLKKEGRKLISQPIKGTIRRGSTPAEDAALQYQLRHDEKELAENMMIVDLVRNDLRRSCATGTVRVEEMFGIYGFKQVSQMISTVSGELQPEKDLVDALIGAFPMGSMTGAPKIRAMQLIEQQEKTKRGLYSGTFGYITSDQDCDFNVVIRSIQYNASTKYLSFMVGSAITFDSDPAREYQECLLKAKAIMQVLGQSDSCEFE